VTEWKPFWQPKLTVSAQRTKAAEVADREPTAGFCECVGDEIDPLCEGRYCLDRTFCPASCFKDPKVFARCTTRLEKMKMKQPRGT
jgi:hypothetical protein